MKSSSFTKSKFSIAPFLAAGNLMWDGRCNAVTIVSKKESVECSQLRCKECTQLRCMYAIALSELNYIEPAECMYTPVHAHTCIQSRVFLILD
jgi:hypothetical protein